MGVNRDTQGHLQNLQKVTGVLCVAQGHGITSYGSWHAHEKKKTGLPTGMSHRTACGWSQVRIDSGHVALCGPVPFAVTRRNKALLLTSFTLRLKSSH